MSTVPAGGAGPRFDAIAHAFYPLYRRLFGERGSFVDGVERALAAARMPHPVEMYLSMALAAGTFAGGVLWAVGLTVGHLLFNRLGVDGPRLGVPVVNEEVLWLVQTARVPALILATALVFGTAGFALGFGGVVGVPYLRANGRKREINVLLPDAVSFMYALSEGGMNQLEMLEALADAEDTYGEVAREFRTILLYTEYFDTDYRSAIRRQALETPSDPLSQFLTDMLSVIDSGGDLTRFLDDKKTLHFRTAKQEQERVLETLELFAELFVTLSLFPLLLIIVLVVLSMLGQGQQAVLLATVYLLIPVFGTTFLVIVSTVIRDDPGDGVLHAEQGSGVYEAETGEGPFDYGLVDRFAGRYRVFDRIRRREGTYRTLRLLQRPDLFLRDNPIYTLVLTVPAAAMFVGVALLTGSVPTTWGGLVARPVWGTAVYVYVPLLVVGTPLAVFHEWNVRSRRGILDHLSEDLRKLSSANDTGLTLLEAMRTVAETSSGRLADELETVHAKSVYGMNLTESFVVFNNRYRLPALARTIKLVTKAQEASSQISSVLTTAAQAAENRDDIERERRARTRVQVVIVVMTFLTLLGVMAMLKVRFIDVLARIAADQSSTGGSSFAAAIDADLLSMLFFHAVTLQAVVTGLVAGYIRDARILYGVRYVVVLLVVTLLTWGVVG
jgi:flagellar protein FlaJ